LTAIKVGLASGTNVVTAKLKEFADKIHWAWEEAYCRRNIDALDEIYAPDVLIHAPPFPDQKGVDSYKRHAAEALQLYTDIRYDWEEIIGEGNTIVDRFAMHMKHTGTSRMLNVPPTGKDLTVMCCRIAHVRGGKIVEDFNYSDLLGLFQQLGIVPQIG
jgi:predicted ester cyclase